MLTDDLFLLAGLLLVALLVGWLTGRLSRGGSRRTRSASLPGEYFRGLNFLLNEQSDKALEVFIRMVEVDSDTLETHFALGSLFRRRGEVDRAIRIHQNLIARPNLSRKHRTQALFELGEDYLKAGLLDRAESLFTELAREKMHIESALNNLILIFEQQKDWEKAIDAARQLESVTGKYRNREIAHYYCELAERELAEKNWRAAARVLRRANAFDKDAPRVAMLNAQLAEGEGDIKRAVRGYQRALAVDPGKATLIMTALNRLYVLAGRAQELDDVVRQVVREHPIAAPAIAIAALRDPSIQGPAIDDCLEYFLGSETGLPGLDGLKEQVDELCRQDEGITVRALARVLVQQAQGDGHRYHCAQCGYHARSLYWQCPSCRRWDSFTPEFDLVLSTRRDVAAEKRLGNGTQ